MPVKLFNEQDFKDSPEDATSSPSPTGGRKKGPMRNLASKRNSKKPPVSVSSLDLLLIFAVLMAPLSV